MPVLAPERSDYLFTDPSEQAVSRADNRFSRHHFFRATALGDEGLREQGFDLVVSAGRPPAQAVFDALAPGGLALVIAPTPDRLTGLLFDHRPENAPEAADAPFRALGFEVEVVSDAGVAKGAPRQSLLIARRPLADAPMAMSTAQAEARRRVLLVSAAEQGGPFVIQLAAALQAAGQTVTIRAIEPADVTEDGFAALVTSEPEADEFVHLAGWAAQSAGLDGQDMRCLSAILLGRAIEAQSIAAPEQNYAPTLTLVTRGALAGPGGTGPLDPFQAPLAGLGRVIANEQASLGCRLIDVHAAVDDVGAAQGLADALIGRDDETEVLLLDGRRYVNRVRSSSAADANAPVLQAELPF